MDALRHTRLFTAARVGLLAAVMLCAVSCIFNYEDCSIPEPDNGLVMLHLNVAAPATATRTSTHPDAYLGDAAINTLRVIIISEETGNVEVNSMTSYSSSGEYKYLVKAEDYKTVYLIANEPSEMTLGLFGISSADDLADLTVSGPQESGNLVMSAVYQLPVRRSSPEYESSTNSLSYTLYLMRVATKFTVNIFNQQSVGITVNNVTIGNLADKAYILPHVSKTENSITSTIIHSLRYTPDGTPKWTESGTGQAPVISGGDNADADKSYSDYYRDNYVICNDAVHSAISVPLKIGNADPVSSISLNTGEDASLAPVFKYESCNLNADSHQEYTLSMELVSNKTIMNLTGRLDISALPRNTHVVIDVTVSDRSMDLTVEVQPYGVCTLDPVFGIARD